MYHAIEKGADLAVGSRYIKGGEVIDWGFKRKIMSKGAVLLARYFTNIKDPVSGFFMIRKECLPKKKINPKGFKILLELIVKGDCKRIKEIPIVFVNRKKGKSKIGLHEIISYLSNLISYISYKK